MGHFIGYVRGSRGRASRLGTKDTGMNVEGNGWNIGGNVDLRHFKKGEIQPEQRTEGHEHAISDPCHVPASAPIDRVFLEITGGSNGRKTRRIAIGTYVHEDGKEPSTFLEIYHPITDELLWSGNIA